MSGSVSLLRAKIMKHHKLAPCIEHAANPHEACVALQKEIVAWMKGTKYPVASCVVDTMGQTDFKATITLAKGAAEFDARKFLLALGLV